MSSKTFAWVVVPGLFLLPSLALASTCEGLPAGQQRVVNELETLGYVVQCGSISFPIDTTTSKCTNGSEFSPNPSSCYGSFALPPRAGGALSPNYKLDNDEAVVFIGTTPPQSYYFGIESYVYSRSNPLAADPATSYVDIFASVGPAVNQRTVSAIRARTSKLEQEFGEYVAMISTANTITDSDFETKALPYLFSASPQAAAITAAQEITNLEMLPVDLIELGTTGDTDFLSEFVRLTPFTTSPGGPFNSASVSYMSAPGATILRVSPATPRTSGPLSNYYTLADDPMPPTKIEPGVTWEQELLNQVGVTNESQALQALVTNVVADAATRGLTLQHTYTQGSGVTPLSNVQGRTCLSDFEAAVASGSEQAVADSQHCAADSADADYVSVKGASFEVPAGGEIVMIGVNHGTLGSATYSNVYLEDPSADAAALTNVDLNGSATTYASGIPAAADEDFYVATFAASCAGQSYCIPAPAGVLLDLGERIYLAPDTGTKPDYTDVFYPIVLQFQ